MEAGAGCFRVSVGGRAGRPSPVIFLCRGKNKLIFVTVQAFRHRMSGLVLPLAMDGVVLCGAYCSPAAVLSSGSAFSLSL